jgi:stage II sporulation protein AA (anti-sigma F factor antagonist)
MTQDDFSQRAIKVGDVHVVTLKGELDIATAEGLSDWLMEIAGSPVVVDLSGVTFVDSSGISAFIMAQNGMRANGDELILSRPHPFVKRTLEIVGLADWVADWNPRWDSPLN